LANCLTVGRLGLALVYASVAITAISGLIYMANYRKLVGVERA